jgi:hypothetical protein
LKDFEQICMISRRRRLKKRSALCAEISQIIPNQTNQKNKKRFERFEQI